MTTKKEFHELMQEMKDCYEEGIDTMKFISISGRFISLAIDRIKRLERALEICKKEINGAIEFLKYCGYEAFPEEPDFQMLEGFKNALEQIKKELGE